MRIDYRLLAKRIGMILVFLSAAMLVPAGTAALASDASLRALLLAAAITEASNFPRRMSS